MEVWGQYQMSPFWEENRPNGTIQDDIKKPSKEDRSTLRRSVINVRQEGIAFIFSGLKNRNMTNKWKLQVVLPADSTTSLWAPEGRSWNSSSGWDRFPLKVPHQLSPWPSLHDFAMRSFMVFIPLTNGNLPDTQAKMDFSSKSSLYPLPWLKSREPQSVLYFCFN